MGRIMQALPSFLTPPRSSKHQTFVDVQDLSDDETPNKAQDEIPPHMTNRERRRAQEEYRNNGTNGVRNGRDHPPSSFKMPYERARPSSSSIPLDRPKSPPPNYNRTTSDTSERRQTWTGAPGPTAAAPAEDNRNAGPRINDARPPEAQAVPRSLEDYKTTLKEWKQHHNVFMSGFQDSYLPALEQCFLRISPQLKAALQPLCAPQELQFCLRHWEQETTRFAAAALACANTVTALVRNAWNEVVVLNEPSVDALTLMAALRVDMDAAYDVYVKALEASKENLWYTLDFNIEGHQDAKYEIRESFLTVFDKLQLVKEEYSCGLFTLGKPGLDVNGSRRVEATPARHRQV